ncbi:MAG: phage/plasmid primase, P4 family, partial [Thermoplasmatales archaeon]
FEYLKDRKNRAVSLVYYDPKSGIYRKDGEDKVRYILEHSLGNSAVVNIKNEVVQHLKDQGFEYLDRWLENSNPHIAVNNGTINLRKFVEEGDPEKCLEPFTPEFHSSSKLDVDYDPHAPCDLLINHLNLVIPDSSDLDRFQKFIGSFLETDGYGHQKIFIAYGRGGSGKTVTLRLFSKFFGIENISSKSFRQLTEDRFATADLFSAMANIVEELPDDAIRYLQSLNSLTGGLVDGQKKGRDPFNFYQNAKIIAACNDLPEIHSNSETTLAFMSRLIIIVFGAEIRGTDIEIQNYDDVLLTQKSGILNWVLQGYRNYVLAGKKISASKSTDETFDYYAAHSDFLKYFTDGCFERGDPVSDFVIKEQVWQAYVKAAKMKNVPTQSRQTVLQKFPTKTKYPISSERILVAKVDGKPSQQHVFKGIRLKKEEEWFTKTDNDDEDFHGEGSGSEVGKSGDGSSELPRLPTLDEYRSKDNRSKSGNSYDELSELPTSNPHTPSHEEKINSDFNTTIEYLKSKGLTLNESASKVEGSREFIYVLHPYRPDELMKEAGFSFLNLSKEGVLYERDRGGGRLT